MATAPTAVASDPIQYEVNESYFQGRPHFAKMIFKDVEQSTARITAWLNDETDLLWPVTANDEGAQFTVTVVPSENVVRSL